MSYMRSPIYVIGSRRGVELMFPFKGEFAGDEYGYAVDHFCMIPYDIFDDLVIGHIKRMSEVELQEALDRYVAHHACYDEESSSCRELQEKIKKVFWRGTNDV